MPRHDFTREEIQGYDLEWLVDLTYGGNVIRLSSSALTVPSAAGDLAYHDGLLERPWWRRQVSLFTRAAQPERMTLELLLPVDVAALAARGHRLPYLPVSVSLVRVRRDSDVATDTYEERLVCLTGRAMSVRYGSARNDDGTFAGACEVFLTVERPLWDAPGRVPRVTEQVSRDTWAVDPTKLSEGDLGKGLPYVYGYPGKDPLQPSGWLSAHAMRWGRKTTLFHVGIVAKGAVDASTVMLNTDDDPYGQEVTLSETRDQLGTLVTIVDYDAEGYESGAGELPESYRPGVADATKVYVAWHDGGGMTKPGGGVIRGAGDVLLHLWQHAGAPIDYGYTAAAVPFLNGWNIDTVIEASCSPIEWVEGQLLPLLPLSIIQTERGLAPVVWRPDLSAADSVLHINADLDPAIETADTVSWEGSAGAEIVNTFTLRYGYSARVGAHQRTARLGPKSIDSTQYAVHQLVSTTGGTDPRRINLQAATRGPDGAGILVVVADTGSESYAESTTSKTVTITIDGTTFGSTTTTASLAALINGGTLLTATYTDADSAVAWVGTSNSGLRTLLADAGTRGHPLCASSQAMMRPLDAEGPDAGIRREDTETRILYDHTTAARVLDWKAAAYALPPRRHDVSGPVHSLWGPKLGACVTYTDQRFAFDEDVSTVEVIETDGITMAYRLHFSEAHRR